jgi:hypothetical protein
MLPTLLVAPSAQADVVIAPSMLDDHLPLSVRLWGMGGASAAVAQGGDGPSANPAGAVLDGQTEVIIGFVDTRSEGAPKTYGVVEAADLSPAERALSTPVLDQEAGEAALTWGPIGAGRRELTGGGTSHLSSAHRCGPDGAWAWGVSATAAPEADASFLGIGVLSPYKEGISLGLHRDRVLEATGAAIDRASVGVGYESRDWTFAVDFARLAGDLWQEQVTAIGAERRLDNGFALRMGSARGDLTYGIGYRKGDWCVDLARLRMGWREAILPGVLLKTEADFTVFSVSCGL